MRTDSHDNDTPMVPRPVAADPELDRDITALSYVLLIAATSGLRAMPQVRRCEDLLKRMHDRRGW